MATRNILDYQGNVMGELTLPDETTEECWTEKLAEYAKPPVQPTMHQVVEKKIEEAKEFGDQILRDFATENVLMGITQAGKTVAVTDYLHKLSHYIMTGSLYAALAEIEIILADDSKSDLAPYVTNERITQYKVKIQQYLG